MKRSGGRSLGALVRNVWRASKEDDLLGVAAQLSFYFLLSLFPLLIFLSAVAGEVFAAKGDWSKLFLDYLTRVMPDSTRVFVSRTLEEITNRASAEKISLSLLATLWTASSGMAALIKGLNRAYGVKEARRWWKRRVLALWLTLLLSTASVAGLVLVPFGRRLGLWLDSSYGFGGLFDAFWFAVRYLFLPAFLSGAIAVIYRYAPNRVEQSWRSLAPGVVAAMVVWFSATTLFQEYLQRFGSYSRTYGSLGAVIVLMMWLYATGVALLLGGEVNSEYQRR